MPACKFCECDSKETLCEACHNVFLCSIESGKDKTHMTYQIWLQEALGLVQDFNEQLITFRPARHHHLKQAGLPKQLPRVKLESRSPYIFHDKTKQLELERICHVTALYIRTHAPLLSTLNGYRNFFSALETLLTERHSIATNNPAMLIFFHAQVSVLWQMNHLDAAVEKFQSFFDITLIKTEHANCFDFHGLNYESALLATISALKHAQTLNMETLVFITGKNGANVLSAAVFQISERFNLLVQRDPANQGRLQVQFSREAREAFRLAQENPTDEPVISEASKLVPATDVSGAANSFLEQLLSMAKQLLKERKIETTLLINQLKTMENEESDRGDIEIEQRLGIDALMPAILFTQTFQKLFKEKINLFEDFRKDFPKFAKERQSDLGQIENNRILRERMKQIDQGPPRREAVGRSSRHSSAANIDLTNIDLTNIDLPSTLCRPRMRRVASSPSSLTATFVKHTQKWRLLYLLLVLFILGYSFIANSKILAVLSNDNETAPSPKEILKKLGNIHSFPNIAATKRKSFILSPYFGIQNVPFEFDRLTDSDKFLQLFNFLKWRTHLQLEPFHWETEAYDLVLGIVTSGSRFFPKMGLTQMQFVKLVDAEIFEIIMQFAKANGLSTVAHPTQGMSRFFGPLSVEFTFGCLFLNYDFDDEVARQLMREIDKKAVEVFKDSTHVNQNFFELLLGVINLVADEHSGNAPATAISPLKS